MPIIDYPQIIERTNRELVRLDREAAERFEIALRRSYRALLTDLRDKWDEWESASSLMQSSRASKLSEIRSALELINRTDADEITSEFRDVLEQVHGVADEGAMELLDAGMPIGVYPTAAAFSTTAIEAAANQAREGIDRLQNHTATFAKNTSTLISQALLQGTAIDDLAEQISQQFGMVLSRATTIARTEVTSANVRAASDAFDRNGVTQVILYVTDDDRLCPICGARAGNVYTLGEILVPLHPNCRCFIAPYFALGTTQREKDWLAAYRDRVRSQPDYLDEGASAFELAAGMSAPIPIKIAA